MMDKPLNSTDSQRIINEFRKMMDDDDLRISSNDYILPGKLILKLRNWFVSRGTHIESGELLHELMHLIPTIQAPVVPTKQEFKRIRGQAWVSMTVYHENSGFDEEFWDRFYDLLTHTHQEPAPNAGSEEVARLREEKA